MNFKDYSAQIAKMADVNQPAARRVIRALFDDMTTQLNKGENVVLPNFGRLVNQVTPGGGNRILLSRPENNAKPVQPVKKAQVKTAGKPRPAGQKKQ